LKLKFERCERFREHYQSLTVHFEEMKTLEGVQGTVEETGRRFE
jgi:hypothetical protein